MAKLMLSVVSTIGIKANKHLITELFYEAIKLYWRTQGMVCYTFSQITKDVRGKKGLLQKIKDIFANRK